MVKIKRKWYFDLTILQAILIVLLFFLVACSKTEFPKDSQLYEELKDLKINLTIDKVTSKKINDKENVFVYFEYEINNLSSDKVYFNPGKIQLKVNSVLNTETYYGSSMGSAPTEEIDLPKGETSYYLYAVFYDNSLAKRIDSIRIENAGILMQAFKQM